MQNRESLIYVIIDGDGTIFSDQYISRGEEGGKEAGNALWTAVTVHCGDVLPVLSNTKIITRIYANIRQLADNCHKAGIVSSPSVVEDFVRGFNDSSPSFDFIDAGTRSNAAYEKILGRFSSFFHPQMPYPLLTDAVTDNYNTASLNCHTRLIILGGSHDDSYAHLLEEVKVDSMHRVSLLEAIPCSPSFGTTKHVIGRANFGDLFRTSRLPDDKKNTTDGFDRAPGAGIIRRPSAISPDTSSPKTANTTSSTATQATAATAGTTSTSTTVPEPQQHQKEQQQLQQEQQQQTKPVQPPSQQVSPTTARVATWASKASANASTPLKDLTKEMSNMTVSSSSGVNATTTTAAPISTTGVTAPTTTTTAPSGPIVTPVVQRNKHGQRVDNVDFKNLPKLEIHRLKQMKLCNSHYLLGECNNPACVHVHDKKIASFERRLLHLIARMTPCRYGPTCDDATCIYGHRCPYSTPGVEDCRWKNECRFPKSAHGVDLTVVRTTTI